MLEPLVRFWWRLKVAFAQAYGRMAKVDPRPRLCKLAFEAAQRRQYGQFFLALDLADGVSDWHPAWLANVALAYYDAGRVADAEEQLATALEKAPEDPTVLACYGEFLQKKDLHNDSIPYLVRATGMMPANARSWGLLGEAYRVSGLGAKARECYLRALECQPGSQELGWIYNSLAFLAADLGDWTEAARFWREAAARVPRTEYVWYNLGDALLHAGDYRGAVQALRKDLRVGLKKPDYTYYDLAYAYYRLGDLRRAMICCERVLDLTPDAPDALELKRELQKACTK